MKKKRILFYNWAQFDDRAQRGGGVSVYLKNLIEALVDRDDLEIYVLSAGKEYSYFKRACHVVPTRNVFSSKGVQSFSIFNSPIKAPAHDMFNDVDEWHSNLRIVAVFRDFLKKHGNFDVVNIHNIEGISPGVLALKSEFPNTRFVQTWHNYIPLCPQVDLLFQSRKDCGDYANGMKCVGCVPRLERRRQLLAYDRIGSTLERIGFAGKPLGNYLFDMAQAGIFYLKAHRSLFGGILSAMRGKLGVWRPFRPKPRGFPRIDPNKLGAPLHFTKFDTLKARGEGFRQWRETNVALANNLIDVNLVVSDVVRDTIVGYGVKPEKIVVAPLGMDLHASPQQMLEAYKRKPQRDRMVFSFIGYGNASKGLHFMADALEAADSELLKQDAELVVVARLNEIQRRQLVRLEAYFSKVTWIPGYERDQLPRIAAMVDVNIVPSIWRETYNQVGYELLCLGVPSILASKVGLSMFYEGKEDFIFPTGDGAGLLQRMCNLVEDKKRLDRFWDVPVNLPKMEDHVELILPQLLGA